MIAIVLALPLAHTPHHPAHLLLPAGLLSASATPRHPTATLQNDLIGRYIDANEEKLTTVKETSRRVLERIDDSRRRLGKLKRRNCLFRLFQRVTIREIARNLEVDGELAISNEVEIQTRQILSNQLYPHLQKLLSNGISEMNELLAGIKGVSTDCVRMTDKLFRLSPRSTAPGAVTGVP